MPLARAFATFLFSALLAAAQTKPPAAHPRWALHWNSGKGDYWIDQPSCHPLQYFSGQPTGFDYGSDLFGKQPEAINDDVESQRIGTINGFAIYGVVHKIDAGELFMKMILVERRTGEFCEIFQEDYDSGVVIPESAYIVNVESEPVLATHDRVTGTGGFYIEEYWTFDQEGPIPLNLDIIAGTVKNLLPDGLSVNKGGGFRIETVSYEAPVWKEDDANCCPTGGKISMKFALKDHRLAIVSKDYVAPR